MTPDRRAPLARHLVPVAHRAIVIAVAGLLALAGVAAAESPGPGASGGPAASGGSAISIIQTTFQPADLTIQAGQTVTWTVTQAIDAPHSVTSGQSTDAKPGTVFDSGITLRNNGDSFSHTFETAGTFAYFCAVHPSTMHGTITVTEASGSEAGPSATTSKLITATILVVVIVLLLGWARLYRRMNRA
ncbi:MAG TPA: plastocyanin/azurin family copper-binding protein [Candidatus Limnocylindrales bacterium]|nr:plastocyanin/azurin family copper-binding protein [Candidatus Limnocylindrales bacterium]